VEADWARVVKMMWDQATRSSFFSVGCAAFAAHAHAHALTGNVAQARTVLGYILPPLVLNRQLAVLSPTPPGSRASPSVRLPRPRVPATSAALRAGVLDCAPSPVRSEPAAVDPRLLRRPSGGDGLAPGVVCNTFEHGDASALSLATVDVLKGASRELRWKNAKLKRKQHPARVTSRRAATSL